MGIKKDLGSLIDEKVLTLADLILEIKKQEKDFSCEPTNIDGKMEEVDNQAIEEGKSMEKEGMNKLLARINRVYKMFKPSPEVKEEWLAHFSSCDEALVNKAFESYVARGEEWPPNIGQLWAEVRALSGEPHRPQNKLVRVDELFGKWEQEVAAIQVQYYQDWKNNNIKVSFGEFLNNNKVKIC